MAFEELSLANELLSGGEVSRVADLIFARDQAKIRYGVSSDRWGEASKAMLPPFIGLSSVDRAEAEAEAHHLLIEELKRQREEQ